MKWRGWICGGEHFSVYFTIICHGKYSCVGIFTTMYFIRETFTTKHHFINLYFIREYVSFHSFFIRSILPVIALNFSFCFFGNNSTCILFSSHETACVCFEWAREHKIETYAQYTLLVHTIFFMFYRIYLEVFFSRFTFLLYVFFHYHYPP